MKMKKKIQIILTVCFVFLLFSKCSEGDFVYDSNQKHTIYFDKKEKEADVFNFSFVYYSITDTVFNIPVRYIGVPQNEELTFKVKVVKDSLAPLAIEGEDYELVNVKFKPNEVLTNLQIKLNRSAHLQDTTYGIFLKFEENENFKPMFGTSYGLIVADGELPKPTWWSINKRKPQNMFLGIYYPEKYRMFLDRFKAMEKKFPDFYKYATENYGEFLETIPEDADGKIRNFYFYKYSAIWGRYIFKPVWEYFTDPEHILPGDDISLMRNPIQLYQ